MPAAEVAARVRQSLESVKVSDLENVQLIEVLRMAQQLTDTMQMFFGSLDKSIHAEFNSIAEYIAKTRDEIAHLRPNDIRESRLPGAGAELEALIADTERATETIMSEAEALMISETDDLDAYKMEVSDAMTKIIEACSFQDLTGQRVSKVVSSLKHIEERVARFAQTMGVNDAEATASEKAEEERKAKLHLNGPAIGGPEVDQSNIDDLLAMDQDAIDALFD